MYPHEVQENRADLIYAGSRVPGKFGPGS